MAKRDLLKGRVKRLLREQKDMGQVAEPAVLCCVSAVQVFVRDLARKMQAEASSNGLTPIELKKSVLACEELSFLHEKVSAVDESAAKYHKPARGGKKRVRKATGPAKPSKKARATAASTSSTSRVRPAASAAFAKPRPADGRRIPVAKDPSQPELEIQEDDNYDESESD